VGHRLSRSIETLAEVLTWEGKHERAAQLFGAAEGPRDAVGASVLVFYRVDYDRAIATLHNALGAEAFDLCWRKGRTLTLDEAVRYALAEACS